MLEIVDGCDEILHQSCWVGKESAKKGRSEASKRNTTIINNFDFYLKIRRVGLFSLSWAEMLEWKKENFLQQWSAWRKNKCVINENEIIDKKAQWEKKFPFVPSLSVGEKLHSLVSMRRKRRERSLIIKQKEPEKFSETTTFSSTRKNMKLNKTKSFQVTEERSISTKIHQNNFHLSF